MLENIREYWYLWLILVLLSAFTVFMFRQAALRGRKRRAARDAQIALLEHTRLLKERYGSLDEAKLQDTQDGMLFEGVAANIQMYLEKQPHMDRAFGALNVPRQTVYALWYFAEDADKKLSGFFRKNGEPLTTAAVRGLQEIGAGKLAATAREAWNMFDEDNESVSLDVNRLGELDTQYAHLREKMDLHALAAAYIHNHAAAFLEPFVLEESAEK